MSYNTRRTTGGAAGRPSPTTQVNYHQQPNRTAGGNTAQQNRNANVGYSTTQQPANYNSAAQPAYSTPAYTTTPPLPPAQPKTAVPAQQPQAPPPPPSAPVAKPPVTPAAKPPVTPATTPMPVLKQEPVTPADTPKMDTTENGDSGATKAPFWKKRPFVKVSNKVRRARQNAKLRRILNPKNALTFLNELRPGTGKFIVREDPGWGYVATVEVDGKTFTGHGLGASKAKVQASERALKYLLLEQLSKSQQAVAETKEEPKEDEAMDTAEQEGEEPKAKKQKVLPEDEVPWGSLAAFALHKLFMEWQKEGPVEATLAQQSFPVEKYDEDVGEEEQYFSRRPPVPPEFGYRGRGFPRYPSRGRGFAPYRGPPPPGFGLPHPVRRPLPPSVSASSLFDTPLRPQQAPVNAAGDMQPMKKIPEDANQRHPVMLLNQLKPNVIYNESREGEQPMVTFVITIDIDGQQYVGRGRNKKEAKKQAAKAALAPLGIIYNEEDPVSLNY